MIELDTDNCRAIAKVVELEDELERLRGLLPGRYEDEAAAWRRVVAINTRVTADFHRIQSECDAAEQERDHHRETLRQLSGDDVMLEEIDIILAEREPWTLSTESGS